MSETRRKRESAPSFFEGTEKKVELVVDDGFPSLRDLGPDHWDRIVGAAGAQVLSRISNDRCDAYLLAESSLFVFEHKMLMITCGRTHLPGAVFELLHTVPPDRVRFFIYERKNETFPHRQPSSFFDDVRLLDGSLPGRAYRFGEEDGHHIYVFHLDRPFGTDAEDSTLEILMHGIDARARSEFARPPGGDRSSLRRRTGIDRILPGYEIDDYLFEPGGYSANAILDDQYWTLHVTPEEFGSYVSFETNHRFGDDREALIRVVLDAFRPRSFDLVAFDQVERPGAPVDGYHLKNRVEQDLSCGYRVRFHSFFRPSEGVGRPVEIPVGGSRRETERT